MNKDWKYGILDDAVNKGSSNISLNKIQEEKGVFPVFGAQGLVKNVSFYQQEKAYLALIKDGAGIGRVSKHPAKSSILATMQYIIPKEEYDIDFIKYFLEGIDFEDYRTGSTIPHIYYKDYKTARFPLVGINEQQHIVAILDEAFEAIDQAKANIEKNIENAKELFQSKLNDIFSQKGEGWEEKALGKICKNLDSKRVPITKSKRIAGDIPYYGASGIVDYVADYLFDEDLLLVSEDGANLLARTYPIAFSISGKTWVNNHAHALRFANMTSQNFVEYYLNSIKLDDFVSGMAQPKLNQAKLNSIPVPFPSIDIQEKTILILDSLNEAIESITSTYKTKIESLEELKKSILQKAFTGQLTYKTVGV